MRPLTQWIPSDVCLKCQVCCRFPTPESNMFPLFMKEEVDRLPTRYRPFFAPIYGKKTPVPEEAVLFRPSAKRLPSGDGTTCACPFFEGATHACAIYGERPLDCQLYPFLLTESPTGKRVFLSLDLQCPFIRDPANQEALFRYGEDVRDFLEAKDLAAELARYPGLVDKEEETFFPVTPLGRLTENRFQETLFGAPPPPVLSLSPVRAEDRESLTLSFESTEREFSGESFASLFVFSDLLRLYWKKENETLFVIAEQGNQFFMPIPPVAPKRTAAHLEEGFRLLSRLNPPGIPPRIEGLSEEGARLAEAVGCRITPKNPEYLYRRGDLVVLRGEAYKSKRSALNYFTKHYDFTEGAYRKEDFWECLSLFKKWQRGKLAKARDLYEAALLEDAVFVHRRLLAHAGALGVSGKVVTLGGDVKGYTFGAPLGEKTFCILLEVTDPDVKGLSQYLFREFCRDLAGFDWINAMDDSGLPGLRRVKRSYRPALEKIPYAATLEAGRLR